MTPVYRARKGNAERRSRAQDDSRRQICRLAFEGTGAEIGAAWDALLRDWLPKSGLQLDSRPFFEHYPMDGRYDPKTGSFTCNICVPVAQL